MALSKIDKANRLAYLRAITAEYVAGRDPEAIAAQYPTLVARFSVRNVMLILAQRGDATECAGFHDWRKVGRSVRKGAKGIAILVPMGTVTDDDGDTRPRFSYRYVFDVSDTEPLSVDELSELALV
jgi:hypothetical protein